MVECVRRPWEFVTQHNIIIQLALHFDDETHETQRADLEIIWTVPVVVFISFMCVLLHTPLYEMHQYNNNTAGHGHAHGG